MNTSKPVTICYCWDKENFEKAFVHAYEYQFKHSVRRYIGWLFIAMVQFGVVVVLKGGSVGLLLFSTILILYWYFIKRWLIYRRTLTSFKHSEFRDMPIALEANKDGIKQHGTVIPWKEIQRVIFLDDAILLYNKDKTFYIPHSAFSSLEEKSRFKSFAKEKERLVNVQG
ncbi:MAG: YcxB family protein [Sulfurovum sp.]|nr:YcxB family protein [Sulfurovum sp.]MCB4774477.1 YcxB family protein [Sulfurovum sp.]